MKNYLGKASIYWFILIKNYQMLRLGLFKELWDDHRSVTTWKGSFLRPPALLPGSGLQGRDAHSKSQQACCVLHLCQEEDRKNLPKQNTIYISSSKSWTVTTWSNNLIPGTSQDMNTYVHSKTSTLIFTVTLLMVTKRWKQSINWWQREKEMRRAPGFFLG